MSDQYRIEKDSMGEVRVPVAALYAAQTQRAIDNFEISDLVMPGAFISALGLVKYACAQANHKLGKLDELKKSTIAAIALEIFDGKYHEAFLVDVFQTGSGTSSNMNANEVISNLCKNVGVEVHPNDDVNMGQSSNDVVPTSIAVAVVLEINKNLLPAINHLVEIIEKKGEQLKDVVKTGRTHLMDAMPITMQQELNSWKKQLQNSKIAIENAVKQASTLALGGTAVGTGINTHSQFSRQAIAVLNEMTRTDFKVSELPFEAMGNQDLILAVSASVRNLSVSLTKICNDLRWMNSGPLAGLGEIALPALQPGSSIMPGKVNPVIPEAVAMACAQVAGNDLTIHQGAMSGNFQLNVMLPVICYNILQSIALMTSSCHSLANKAIQGFEVRLENINASLDRNPILVTALNSIIGYEKAAKIAKLAYSSNRPVVDVAVENTDLTREELLKILSPGKLTHPQE